MPLPAETRPELPRAASPTRRRLLGLALLAPAMAALAEEPGDFIAAHAAEHAFSGSVLVRKRADVVYARSFGLASRAFGVRNGLRTRYRIASITKAFTAVLVLQLHEQGRVDLHRPIRAYLPGYRSNGAATITAHHLLNHTSGLPNMDTVTGLEAALKDGIPVYQTPMTRDQLLERYCSGDLVAAPGQRFDYNNADYVVLGNLIEQVCGKPYEDVLQAQILDPLDLGDTGLLRQAAIVDGLADCYFYRDDLGAFANDLPVYPENWYAAGAMYATAGDLLAFADALFGGRLLRPASLARMTAGGLDDYGYGVWSYTMRVGGRRSRVVKRPGRIMGAQGQLFRMIDEDITVIALSNAGRVDMDAFVAAIGRRYAA